MILTLILFSTAIILLGIFTIPQMVYNAAQRDAFNRLLSGINRCNTMPQLHSYGADMQMFKDLFTDDEKGIEMWLLLNEMYDETETELQGFKAWHFN